MRLTSPILKWNLSGIWVAVTPSPDASGRLDRFVDVGLQDLAGTERQHTARRDFDVVAGLRIAPLPRALVAQGEVSEAGNLDLVTLFEASLHRFEDLLHDVLRFLLGETTDFFVNDLNQVRFRHVASYGPSRGPNLAAEPIL